MSKIRFRFTLALVFVSGLVFALYAPNLGAHISINSPSVKWLLPLLKWTMEDVLPKIGDAMLIAPILAIVVDAAAKQNLLSEFARDVSSHIIGRHLPPELREHIHTYLTADIIRRDLNVVYTISAVGEAGTDIELETVMTSDLQNCSIKDLDTDIYVSVPKSLSPVIGDTIITEVTAGQFTYRAGDPTDKLEKSGTDDTFRTKVKLPASQPGMIPHKIRCIVKSKEYFPSSGQCPFTAVYPVLGASVTVICPSDFQVDIDLTFALNSDHLVKQVPQNNGFRWTIIPPMLQGQGFFLRWTKVEKSARTV